MAVVGEMWVRDVVCWYRTILENTGISMGRTGGDDREVCIHIYLTHPSQLVVLILGRVLNDTECVYPEIADPRLVSDDDSIPDGPGYNRRVDPDQVLLNV